MTTPTNEQVAAAPAVGAGARAGFFGHPRQLGTLFHIELWERFSFYGMQAILLIYLYYEVTKGGLGMNETKAAAIVGAYNGSIYLATILSGWLSDRLLGAEKTLFWSGVVVMLGHVALAVLPGLSGLVVGLLLIALGSGGVKSSAGAMVGSLYEEESTRALRDAGFSIFYTAINIGGFVGPLIVGVLQVKFGFHYGFGAAAVGMAFGLWQYWRGRASLPDTPPANPLPKQKYGAALGVVAAGLAVIGGCIAAGLLTLDNFSQVLLGTVIVTSLLYFIRLFRDPQVSSDERRHMVAYVPLFIVMCLFWAVWSQVFTVVTVYFDQDQAALRMINGFEIPVAWLSALQSLWVIVFAGVMAALWTKMGYRQPRTPMKFTMAMVILGVSYLCFIPFLTSGTVMPLVIMALLLLTITISELLLSPISLSLATKIAPKSFKTQMVSFNFLTLSLGFTLGGVLVDECYVAEKAIEFYGLLGALGIGGGVVLMLMMRKLNNMLVDVD
ncbi:MULTISPECIES: peptide MFS transporter [Eikenella]|uniref:peptide MFS transporter n=1 Tax=Eikenella TaxID=538 RepID=UPI0009ED1CF6|nr:MULTISPECIES: oligopeptide:H+ symporter [Eikenella]